MPQLQVQSVVRTGNGAFDTGIEDLLVFDSDGTAMLVSATGDRGGVATYALDTGADPDFVSGRSLGDTTDAAPVLLDTEDGDILVAGLDSGAVRALDVYSTGNLSTPQSLSADSADWSLGTRLGEDMLALADSNGRGVTVYSGLQSGTLTKIRSTGDDDTTYADDVTAMDSVQIGGRDILIVASGSERGLTAYEVTPNGVTVTDAIGAADGLSLMAATDLEVVTVDGQSYAVVASAPGAGAVGALSVVEIGADGRLTPVDHLLDTRDSAFAQAQDVASITHDGVTFVAAAGGEGGVSLFAMMPDGRMIHLDSLDSADANLTDVSALEMHVSGNTLRVYASGADGSGITVLRADLSDLGAVRQAGDGGRQIGGTGGDDILSDGNGADTLSGGSGSDIFALQADGATDVITDFDPSQDVLDVSGWPQVFDVSAVTITATSNGARLEAGGEVVDLRGPGNRPLDVDDVRAALRVDVHRTVQPPSDEIRGTTGNDRLTGDWGQDTLQGRSGDDTLIGGAGDDLYQGGSGTDLAVLSVAQDDVSVLNATSGNVTLRSAEGLDIFEGVEEFQFRDGQVSFADLVAGASGTGGTGDSGGNSGGTGSDSGDTGGGSGSDTVIQRDGTDSDNKLTVTTGDARVNGFGGNDEITSGDGNDILMAGSGNDVLRAGRGADLIEGEAGHDNAWGDGGDDTILGGDGDDFLRGGQERDHLEGGNGDDNLRGQRHGDTLRGGDGDDNLNGGGGSDVQYGGAGNDFLKGGTYHDSLEGGAGHDSLAGNAFDDTLKGGGGNDTLNGGGENDVLAGGSGNDILKGGSGADEFHFSRGLDRDVITDFNPDQDVLMLASGLVRGSSTAGQVVDNYASLTSQGVVLDFGNGDRILLEGVNSLNGLDGAIDFL